ncbi:MAG: protein kinase [Ignavibacteria bacterium]|nr:protein kinase [Ignavibacteria bacterium]
MKRKIEAVIQVAETLPKNFIRKKIYHRDIKPANILFYNSRFSLADFGLVDYPNKKEVSLKNEEIGAKWTMAPGDEKRIIKADAAKADIYSLAKLFGFISLEIKRDLMVSIPQNQLFI